MKIFKYLRTTLIKKCMKVEMQHRQNSGNVGYRSVQNLLGVLWSSVYGCENLSVMLRTNTVLRRQHDVEKIFASEGEIVTGVFRNLHNEETRGDL